MKGTLISADFVTDENNNLRLLEINTDTGFISSSLGNLDYTELFNVITSNSVDTVEVIHKDFQNEFVDHLSSSISANLSSVTTFESHIEPIYDIYPTSILDADNKFIIRLAYDEGAILDSEYAKYNVNLYNLFVTNNDTGSLVPFAYSSSVWQHDNLEEDSINTSVGLPDFAVREDKTGPNLAMNFYKVGHNTSSSLERLNKAKDMLLDDETLIQKFYTGSASSDRVTSIRSFKIVYGADLEMLTLGEYEISAILEKPSELTYGIDGDIINDRIVNWVKRHHYFELTTNGLRTTTEGIIGEQEVINSLGNAVAISGSEQGDSLKSFYLHGAPDTDDHDVFRAWSHAGSTLPSGSYTTSSLISSIATEESKYNTVAHIGLADGSFRISPFVYLLVHDVPNNQIVYRFPYEMNTTDYRLFDGSGSLQNINSINIEILSGSYDMYSLNLEEVDNFVLADGGLSSNVVTHNACFIAGTKIILSNGDVKNIEDIVEGDVVVSYNEKSDIQEYKKVIETNSPIHDDLVKYSFSNGEEIICTFDHPFYVNDLSLSSYRPEWTNKRYELPSEVSKIKVGDFVHTIDGSVDVKIINIDELPREDTQTYIFSVEENRNFYANNILVHNK